MGIKFWLGVGRFSPLNPPILGDFEGLIPKSLNSGGTMKNLLLSLGLEAP
jgi:hypothetical protein